jgi:hypothetical protein
LEASGFGFQNLQAKPSALALAWLGLSRGLRWEKPYTVLVFCRYKKSELKDN